MVLGFGGVVRGKGCMGWEVCKWLVFRGDWFGFILFALLCLLCYAILVLVWFLVFVF